MAIRRSEHLVGTTSEFTTRNPVLSRGVLALSYPAKTLKVGDGNTLWNDLPEITLSPSDPVIDGGAP